MLAVLTKHQPYFRIDPPQSVDLLTNDEYYYDDYAYDQPSHDYVGDNLADRDDEHNGENDDDDGCAHTNDHHHPVHSAEEDSDDAMEYKVKDDTAEEDSHGGDSSNDECQSNADNPAFAHSIDDVPPSHRCIIKDALNIDWDIDSPCDFQIVSINRGAYSNDTVMYLISKTGSGKSAVPLTIAMLCRGVTIVLVPLLGLGSHQVKKASRAEKGLCWYHVDEHKGADGTLLRNWLLNMTDEESQTQTTILFMSP